MKTAACLLYSVLCSAQFCAGGVLLSDNFDDNTKDPLRWTERLLGVGPTVQEINGRLEISLPGNASGGEFAGVYDSVAVVSGDFDERVDYSLLEWPPQNGVRVGIGISVAGAVTERISFGVTDFGSGEAYLTHFGNGLHAISTTDTSGSLRLVRSGNLLSGYYWDKNSSTWSLIHTGPTTLGTVHLSLAAWSGDSYFRDVPVKVAFDNFHAEVPSTEPIVVPEPGTMVGALLLLLPLATRWLPHVRLTPRP